MKKLIALLSIAFVLTLGFTNQVVAQEETDTANTEVVDTTAVDTTAAVEPVAETELEAEGEAVEKATWHQVLKEKFIQGGPGFMGVILLCLIMGLALVIERVIYLNLATTNTKKLLAKVENAMQNGGVDAAKAICKDTRGPVAGIFYQGLDRIDEGLEAVEKSIVSYGSVLMGRLEANLSWISLFIAIAPMLGFMGTVIGMIGAFQDIAAAGDISPQIVADGIQVALLTTVFGLIVAVILQVFNNYLVSKVENLVNAMEDSTISFMDILVKNQSK